jgi:two-component system NtrC family sensor kinase
VSEPTPLRLDGPVLQALLDLLPGTLHVKDRALRYCIVNRTYLERWGASAQDVIGRTSEEAFRGFFGPGPDERNREVFATGKALPFYEVSYRDKQGKTLVLWSTKAPILDARGTVTHVLTFSLDITPLKRAQSRLQESELLRSAIVEHSLECFITAEEDGRIVEFNPAAERIFGHTRAQALGRSIGELLHAGHKRTADESVDATAHARALLERCGHPFESTGVRVDGTPIPIEVSLVAIPLRDRRLLTACVRELSERQRAQAELERQRQALYQSERLSVLGTLAAGISHELRNPLSVVLSQAKLLEDALEEDNARSRLEAISRAAERCAAIVAAFLDQARYGPRHAEHFALAKVIDSALDLTEHVLREQQVAVSVEHAQTDVTVMGDLHQLSQVVLNLVLNAVTAMQESDAPKTLTIATAVDAVSDAVELTVADSGPGIPPSLRERIFERFFTTKAAGKGNGLGLAICRDIVFAHGGRISAHESPGGGAMFRVRLPLSRGAPADASAAPAAASPPASHRILVVDDESEIAHLLREILELAGHRVDIADSGEAALACIAQTDYDIVLSDIRMAGMDGTKLYDALRSTHPQLVRRLAFVTGDTLSPNVGAFLRRCGLPYLAKPFHPRQVTELVEQLARQRS